MRTLILAPFTIVYLLVSLAVFLVIAFAAVDGAIRPNRAYAYVGRQSKNVWMLILGVALLVAWFGGFFLKSAALVAGIVYLVDMRPKLREAQRGSRGGGSVGPYGPW